MTSKSYLSSNKFPIHYKTPRKFSTKKKHDGDFAKLMLHNSIN